MVLDSVGYILKECYGNSPVDRWLGLHTFTAGSHKPCGTAKKKKLYDSIILKYTILTEYILWTTQTCD